jgi:hypothetical protein
MTLTRKAASSLLNTQKAIHAFRSIGSKWELARDGVQLNIGKIPRLRINCQWALPSTAAFAVTGAAKGKIQKASVGGMRHARTPQFLLTKSSSLCGQPLGTPTGAANGRLGHDD